MKILPDMKLQSDVHSTENITTEEFAELLEDRTFVDYFNVFLNLPVFAQKVLYRFSERDFEFDPPIRRTKYAIDKAGLVRWLLATRVQHFLASEVYLEYLLCKDFLASSLHLTDSSHDQNRDVNKITQDSEFIKKHVGHVLGMQRFRSYLEGTSGISLYEFWLDAERFSRLPVGDDDIRYNAHREIQLKYFKIGGMVQVGEDAEWKILIDSFKGTTNICPSECTCHRRSSTERNEFPPDMFRPLQRLLLGILKDYWLQKYMVHCRCLEILGKKHGDDDIRVKSLSDLKLVKDVKNVEQALSLVQGNLKPNSVVKKRKATASWKALFPNVKVDDDFMKNTDEVITIHADGRMTIQGGSELSDFDKVIGQSLNDVTASSSEEDQALPDKEPVEDVPIVVKISDITMKQDSAKLTKGNLRLFDQLADFRLDTSLLEPSSSNEKQGANVEHRKLPRLLHTPEGSRKVMRTPSMSSRSFVLPPIREQSKSTGNVGIKVPVSTESKVKEDCPGTQRDHLGTKVAKQDYKFMNTADGSFRFDNRDLVGAMASDCLAGKPLEKFLVRGRKDNRVRRLKFWLDAQQYLSSKPNSLDNAAEHLRFRRAKRIAFAYLNSESHTRPFLPPGLTLTLQKVLPEGKGQDLLKHAQDIVCFDLRRNWNHFQRFDQSEFIKHVLKEKAKTKKSPVADDRKRGKVTVSPLEDDGPYEQPDEEFRGMLEKRCRCAFSLACHISGLGENILPPDQLPYETPDEFDFEDDQGSLCVKPIRRVTRRDIEILLQEEEARRMRLRMTVMAKREEEERQRMIEEADDQNQDADDGTFFLRPIRRGGQWISRPAKPRGFSELLRDSIHMEFFKRYLSQYRADTPLNFYLSIESMRKIKEPKKKLNRVQQLIKKYFNKQDIRLLDCQAQVVMEIPNLERVTPAMLISAQTYVLRSLEEQWFNTYLETFPQEENLPEITISTPGLGRRTWGKERTRGLWINFVRSFICFRRTIHSPIYVLLFRNFLRKEIQRDLAKHNMTPTAASAMTVKKVIRNRLVAVDRLICDLGFVVEADKYLSFCDNVRQAATSGTYRPEDEDLLEMKARAIVECYINSEVPPRLQVNLTQETATTILDTYQQGILERGLFHDGMMAVMPVIMQLWRKFQSQRFTATVKKSQMSVAQIMQNMKSTPDFMNMEGHGRRIKADDDHPKILFSLSLGLRYSTPSNYHEDHHRSRHADTVPSRETVIANHASVMQRRDTVSSVGDQEGPEEWTAMSARRQSLAVRRASLAPCPSGDGNLLLKPRVNNLLLPKGKGSMVLEESYESNHGLRPGGLGFTPPLREN